MVWTRPIPSVVVAGAGAGRYVLNGDEVQVRVVEGRCT